MIQLTTDGACLGNPGPGGWGAVLEIGGDTREIWGGEPASTNNRMEMTAVIEGLKGLPEGVPVTIRSDSEYVIKTITKGWKRNKNNDLWDAMDNLLGKRPVSWKWVRGHAGDVRNERADHLAVAAARQVQRTGRAFKSKSPSAGAAAPAAADSEPEPDVALTHLDASGEARMVPVGDKGITDRVAEAEGSVLMRPETLRLVRGGGFKKGDVIAAARIAGIMAAKSTPQLIPLCHPIPLTRVQVDITEAASGAGLDITASVSASWKTGVEMEALTAVSVAALTVYDMCKSADRDMRIEGIHLVSKRGGKSDYDGSSR